MLTGFILYMYCVVPAPNAMVEFFWLFSQSENFKFSSHLRGFMFKFPKFTHIVGKGVHTPLF